MNDDIDRIRSALSDRYMVEGEIGRGGMAVVYRAQELKHGRKVAVKVLRPDIAEAIGVDRFLNEIRIAANLNHPHIVPVHDSGQVAGMLYFTMPYVEGESLRGRLNRVGRMGSGETLRIVYEVATALSYAHGRGVVHRDIKPENILLSDGVPVVADFGIARAISMADREALTAPDVSLGTMGYMSPEQAAGKAEVDGRSDVFSLGCVLHEMLLGRPPGRWLNHRATETGRIIDASHEERLVLDGLPHPVERILVKALAQSPDERFAGAEEFATALAAAPKGLVTPPPTEPASTGRLVSWIRWIAAAVAVVIVAVVLFGRRSDPNLDPDLLAVAPFDVFGTEHSLWSHGLVDLLSASLDGAGPLRTVPPSVVINRWDGRADAVSAASLGQNLGSGLVLFGQLMSAGSDSVRVVATMYDVTSQGTIDQFDLRDRADRVDRLADSLAVRIMSDLSRSRRLTGWQLRSLGSASPAALRAFLRGERFYRGFVMDSAQWYYGRAVELDSSFALAYSRRSWALGWIAYRDVNFADMQLRAGELNHGLAQRESLLVVADSIRGALSRFTGDSTDWIHYRRLFNTLEIATLLYPFDPQVWYELGEARYHEGAYIGVTDREAYEAFSRAVELDSAFVPAYRHLIELALLLEGRESGAVIAEQYRSRADSSVYRDAAQVTEALLDPDRLQQRDIQRALQALPLEGVRHTWYDLKWWPDEQETAIRVARLWAEYDESSLGRDMLAVTLAYRGHLQEASTFDVQRLPPLFMSLVLLGAVPEDTAEAVLARWLDEGDGFGIHQAQRWWVQHRDTTSLQRAAARWDSLLGERPPAAQPRLNHLSRQTEAYLALAHGDTLEALDLLADIPSWPRCYFCYGHRLLLAQVLARIGRDHEAAELLDHMPWERYFAPASEAVVAALERGRVHERLGNREAAIEAYSYVADAWRNADAVLQPAVEEARRALQRLAGEPI